MPSQTISAANRLREEVLKDLDVILLYESGRPDRVLRVKGYPHKLSEKRTPEDIQKEIRRNLNLDKGPDQEEWKDIERHIFLHAKKSEPIPIPAPVAEDSKQDWSVPPEDVPTVTLEGFAGPESKPEASAPSNAPETSTPDHACAPCGKTFKNGTGLSAHLRFKHKE